MKIKLLILISLFFVFIPNVRAEVIETSFKAEVKAVTEKGTKNENYQMLSLEVLEGEKQGENIEIENNVNPTANPNIYEVGDKVLVNSSQLGEGEMQYFIVDYVRTTELGVLFIIFVVLALVATQFKGLSSIVGMFYFFFILFKFMLPQILSGNPPLLVALVTVLLIAPVTFYLSHGVNKKTTVALASTLFSLLITGVLALIFSDLAHLSGFASEEASFLQFIKQGEINIKGLLLAGVIIGTLGILDDATVSQASIVAQLKKANDNLSFRELFSMSMEVGHDHIASTINTLVLVYTGAALPLFLLFVEGSNSFLSVLNQEIVAEEIFRTLVGSIGLISAVPITTLLAAYFLSDDDGEEMHYHSH